MKRKDRWGSWARVAREQKKAGDVYPFKLDVSGGKYTLRDASNGDLLSIPDTAVTGGDDETRRAQLAQYIKDQNIKEIDVLMSTNDGYDVNGSHLGAVTRGYDEVLNPAFISILKARVLGCFPI